MGGVAFHLAIVAISNGLGEKMSLRERRGLEVAVVSRWQYVLAMWEAELDEKTRAREVILMYGSDPER